MKKGYRLILNGVFLISLSANCTTTRIIKPADQLIFSQEASLQHKNQHETKIKFATITRDSIIFIEQLTAKELRLPRSQCQRLIVTDHLKGGLQGCFFGALAGGIGGAVLGYFKGEDPATDPLATRGSTAFFGGIMGLSAGALAGIIGGGLTGSKIVYQLNPSDENPPSGRAFRHLPGGDQLGGKDARSVNRMDSLNR